MNNTTRSIFEHTSRETKLNNGPFNLVTCTISARSEQVTIHGFRSEEEAKNYALLLCKEYNGTVEKCSQRDSRWFEVRTEDTEIALFVESVRMTRENVE